MRRTNSGYPRTPYGRTAGLRLPSTSRRSAISRRALLTAAGLIGASGLVEALRPRGHHAAVVSDPRPVAAGHPGGPGRHGSSAAGPVPHGPPADRHRRDPGADDHHRPPGHQRHDDHGATHHDHRRGQDGAGQHGHHGRHGDAPEGSPHHPSRRQRREERVTLPPPKVRVRSRPIYSVHDIDVHPPHKAIALTIDDGPDPDWTPKVLRLLDKHRMQASFCVVGIHADAYPGLIRDIHRAGHVIVNHSYTHIQPFAQQTEKRIVAEITRTQRAIEHAAKVTPELFRSPGGDWSHFVFRAVAAYGLTPLDWDVDPRDWARPGRRRIQHRMLHGRPGDIVLCHDGGGDRAETVRALRRVLPAWKHRGYTTIPLVVPESAKRVHGSPSPHPSSSSHHPSHPTGTPTSP